MLVLRVWRRVQNKDSETLLCCSESETSESFNWIAWSGCSPWNIFRIWTFSTLKYCFSDAWENLISVCLWDCLSKLMMIANLAILINILKGGVWGIGQVLVLFVCLVKYSAVLDFKRWRFFLQFWKPRQNYIIELWKCSLKIGGLGVRSSEKTHFLCWV